MLFVFTSSCLLVAIIGSLFAFLWICFGPSSGFVRGDTLDLLWSGFGGYLSALWSGNCPAWWRTISVAISKFGLVLQKGNNNRQLGDVFSYPHTASKKKTLCSCSSNFDPNVNCVGERRVLSSNIFVKYYIKGQIFTLYLPPIIGA